MFARIGTGAAAAAFACIAVFGDAQAQDHAGMHGMATMTPGPLGISMDRMGSGTTWIPDANPLASRHWSAGKWDWMLHGLAFAQYDEQFGERGAAQFGSLNWVMVMASRDALGGRFQGRAMLSLDPATVPNGGYPLLLQSGETYKGVALHDRQHPHDFLMEIGALYERELTRSVAISLYAAPSGEPALGPVAFMHRPSAVDNPFAPLGHHWQDATHIAFGTVTAGLFGRRWKIEGSAFNGREPDEERWGLDPMRIDSYSARLTINPNAAWSATAGFGYLHSPEAHDAEQSVHRTTASVLHSRTVGDRFRWSSSAVWGMNAFDGGHGNSQALLVESQLVVRDRHTIFGRAERAEKSAEDLQLGSAFDHDDKFGVMAATVGYIREIGRRRGATFGIGGALTLNAVPGDLEDVYGTRMPVGMMVFARLGVAR